MNEDNMDLLDLDDGASLDTLPEAPVFAAPRPKKPWLLMGLGVLVIVLATYIIVRTISGDSSSSVDIDLDAPAIVVDGDAVAVPTPADNIMPPAPAAQMPAPAQNPAPATVTPPAPQPVAHPDANVTPGVPVREIEERKNVAFNPDNVAPAPKPEVVKPTPAPAAKPAAKPAAPKPAPKKQTVSASNGSWYVQFGSYSTRAAAESAEKTIRNAHSSLFQGRQFVILAAQMADGSTKYRLRIAFATSADANGFCRNAKSDGVDCYVAK